MARLRRAELQAGIAEDRACLMRVEARLRTIELEDAGTPGVTVRALPAVRVASLSAAAAGLDPAAVSPVLGPLFAELFQRLSERGVQASGAALARYEQIEDADHVLVHACAPILSGSDVNGSGLEVVELSAVESAATAPHTGPFAEISSSCQHLAQWIEEQGQVNAGQPREVYLDTADAADSWQIELQEPIAPR